MRLSVSQRPTLAAVIDRYTDESIKKIGRTNAQVLGAIKGYDIADKTCSEITSADVISFAHELVVNLTPQTIANYLSHLAAVFAVPKPAWAYPLDQTAMKDAFVVAKRLGIASKSRERKSFRIMATLSERISHVRVSSSRSFDLHLHDLRHDGVSRLFEIGRNVPQVAAVSGHRSWPSLKRYTHLRQTGDKYAGWKWSSALTSQIACLLGGRSTTVSNSV